MFRFNRKPWCGTQVMLTTDQHYTMSNKPAKVRWAKLVEPAVVDAQGDPGGERWAPHIGCMFSVRLP